MNENILNTILTEIYDEELARFSNSPEHTFSKKYNRAMKRIFKLYDRNTAQLHQHFSCEPPKAKFRFNRKSIIAVAILIFLALITGFAVVKFFISNNFRGEVQKDNTLMLPINYENAPETIEEKYYLADLSKDFKLIDTDSTPYYEHYYYKNDITSQSVSFYQWVKNNYSPYHYNTENYKLEEVEINENYGICLDLSDQERTHCLNVWDNGDYILELVADMPKNEALDLANSVKA